MWVCGGCTRRLGGGLECVARGERLEFVRKGGLGGGLECVARRERLRFVRKGGYFCVIKTYVLRFNLSVFTLKNKFLGPNSI